MGAQDEIALAALIGWRDHGELSALRVEREKLSAEATALGIPFDDLGDEMRKFLLNVASGKLIERNPKAALELLAGSGNPLNEPSNRQGHIHASLSKWSETEPSGALAWVRASNLDFMGKEGMEAALIHGAAQTDLSLAMNLITGGLVSHAKGAEMGRWVEWMGESLSEEPRDRFISERVRDWTASDHHAAGEWLAALPDGPAKPASVAAFAKTVAPHDPQVACAFTQAQPASPGRSRRRLAAMMSAKASIPPLGRELAVLRGLSRRSSFVRPP